ncbi:MAG: hypothetical protein UFG06_11715 [Lachnospiraceae bacterium]|nr:hypothetical protein [Lachnospiraceae bacterium]
MDFMTKMKQKENCIWALGLSVILCAALGIFFDYYFDLNDDVLMKDILAGVYTGTPESKNIQMLFPISFFLSLLYRLVGQLPWYGLFLCGCHFFSIYLITERLLGFFEKAAAKAAVILIEAGVILALFLQELIFVQYTVTCTLLAAAAAFLFYTSKEENSPGKFFKNNLLSIVLVTVAFQIRSEMLLLVLPLICVTGLCRWACEKPFFTKENAAKYLSVFGGILAGIAVSQLIHMAAYSGADWQRFNRYFDNRTELYDFLAIPPYEGNEAFYESIGMSESEQVLLENYNFGLDEEIDEALLGKISDYAGELRQEQVSFGDSFKKAFEIYKYRTFHATDYPWNLFVLAMYGMVLLAALFNRHFRYLWELLCMGVVRTGLWMYILYRGRDPERITHSLYLMEFVILLAMLLVECHMINVCRLRRGMRILCAGIFTLLCLISITGSVTKVRTEYDRREVLNKEIEALKLYTKEKGENFYFVDVYSTVAYTEKMFQNVDNTIANYDIMGGWASKSPLTEKKLASFDITNMERAVLNGENVYVIVYAEETVKLPKVQEWLPAYYAEKGHDTVLLLTDTIAVDGREVFAVYTLEKK